MLAVVTTQAPTPTTNTLTYKHACKHVQGFVFGSWQLGKLLLQYLPRPEQCRPGAHTDPHSLPLLRDRTPTPTSMHVNILQASVICEAVFVVVVVVVGVVLCCWCVVFAGGVVVVGGITPHHIQQTTPPTTTQAPTTNTNTHKQACKHVQGSVLCVAVVVVGVVWLVCCFCWWCCCWWYYTTYNKQHHQQQHKHQHQQPTLASRLELVPVFHVGMPLLLRPTTSLCDAWYVNGSGMLLCESELTWQELVDFMGSTMASQYVDCHRQEYSCTWAENRGWTERLVWRVQYVWGSFRPGPIFGPGPIQAGADLPIFQAATSSGHQPASPRRCWPSGSPPRASP